MEELVKITEAPKEEKEELPDEVVSLDLHKGGLPRALSTLSLILKVGVLSVHIKTLAMNNAEGACILSYCTVVLHCAQRPARTDALYIPVCFRMHSRVQWTRLQ